MRHLIAIAVVSTFLCTAGAQEIDSPERADEHTLVESVATTEGATGFAWIIRRTGDGFRPRVLQLDGGETAVWTAPPGRYEIDLIALADGSLSQAFTTTTIAGRPDEPDPPEPPDEPDEPDDPDPPTDPNLDAELVSLARSEAEAIDDPQTAQVIAAVYSQVRAALANGEISPGDVFRTLREATDAALAEQQAAADWRPWRDRLSDALGERQARGKLKTEPDFLVMLASIQVGLERSVDGPAITIDQHTQIGRIVTEAIQ